MGIGYVFLGYVFSLNFFVYEGITMLPAVLLMLNGMLTLGAYNRPLREARLWLMPTLVCALACFALEGGRLLSLVPTAVYERWFGPADLAMTVCLLAFTLRLLSGLGELCEETGLPALRFRAKRNLVLSSISYACAILLSLPLTYDWYAAVCRVAFAPFLLFHFAILFLNAKLIYACYMRICLPEDLDMPTRSTGIRFIDNIQKRLDEKEAENLERKKEELEKLFNAKKEENNEKQTKRNKK